MKRTYMDRHNETASSATTSATASGDASLITFAAWLSMIRLTILAGGDRDAAYWSAQLVAMGFASSTGIVIPGRARRWGPMVESGGCRRAKAVPAFLPGFEPSGKRRISSAEGEAGEGPGSDLFG